MSTKAIREALDLLCRTRVDDLGKVSAVLAEIEAIEKAAKDAAYLDADEANCRWWEADDYAKWEGVTDVLKAIAKDAK